MGRKALFVYAKDSLFDYVAIGVPGKDAETGGFGIIVRLEMTEYETRQPHHDLLLNSLALMTPEEAAREQKAWRAVPKPTSSPKPGDVIPQKAATPKEPSKP